MENWYNKLVETSTEIINNHTPNEEEAMVVFVTTPNGEGNNNSHASVMGSALSVCALICGCIEDNPAMCAVIGAAYEYLVSEGKLKPKE